MPRKRKTYHSPEKLAQAVRRRYKVSDSNPPPPLPMERATKVVIGLGFLTTWELAQLRSVCKHLDSTLGDPSSWPLDIRLYVLNIRSSLRKLDGIPLVLRQGNHCHVYLKFDIYFDRRDHDPVVSSGEMLRSVATLGNVISLHLDWGQIDAQGANILKEFNVLKSLDLECCMGVTDEALSCLTSLKSLEELNLGNCEDITDAGVAHLSSLSSLKKLSLRGCDGITDSGLGHISSLLLKMLNLRDLAHATDAGLGHLSSMPLEVLDLSGCQRITDEGLKNLLSLPLHTLNLEGCLGITDGGLAHLSSLLLHTLNLGRCGGITGGGLAHLSSLPLKNLDLSHCSGLTDAAVEHILQMESLERLDVTECDFASSLHDKIAKLDLQEFKWYDNSPY